MLALDEQIDLIIPRGSNEFVRTIMHSTSIPVLGHAAETVFPRSSRPPIRSRAGFRD